MSVFIMKFSLIIIKKSLTAIDNPKLNILFSISSTKAYQGFGGEMYNHYYKYFCITCRTAERHFDVMMTGLHYIFYFKGESFIQLCLSLSFIEI